MWLVVMTRTVQRAISGKLFFAPCLGTDLFLKKSENQGEREYKAAKIDTADGV